MGNWSIYPVAATSFGSLDWQGGGNGMKVICDSSFLTAIGNIIGIWGSVTSIADTNYDIALDVTNNNTGWLKAYAIQIDSATCRHHVLGYKGRPISCTYTLTSPLPATASYIFIFDHFICCKKIQSRYGDSFIENIIGFCCVFPSFTRI